MEVDRALAEIDRLPGRHLYFLGDHLFGNPNFAAALFDGMAGGTVKSVLEQPRILEKAMRSGLRSLFVGFETVNSANLQDQRKYQNIGRDYAEAIRRLHDLGVMVNGSFVFGMDHDGPDVFDRTVEWAVERGIETATYHILTPYPDTALYKRMDADNRVLHHDWDLFDTRHVVLKPLGRRRQSWKQATGGHTLTSFGGDPFGGERHPKPGSGHASATSRMQEAGRSSSHFGTCSSGRSRCSARCPSLRPA